MKLTLVGAGPGDIELLTIKGQIALSNADVVLFDALVNPQMLEYAKVDAIKHNVGKRKGLHFYAQEEINELIVEYCKNHASVVRLKGGDPFVFGRGFEEIQFAKEHGIETEIIPGISSSLGVPAYVGLPLTHRTISQSFWVLTGHTKDGELPEDLHLAASSQATVVILMGMSKLKEIIRVFEKVRGLEEPIAIIQDGSTPYQKFLVSTMENVQSAVLKKSISNPAIIVIGQVVNLLGLNSEIKNSKNEKLLKIGIDL